MKYEVNINANGFGTVLRDGVDISNEIVAIQITASVGQRTIVTLQVADCDVAGCVEVDG